MDDFRPKKIPAYVPRKKLSTQRTRVAHENPHLLVRSKSRTQLEEDGGESVSDGPRVSTFGTVLTRAWERGEQSAEA